MPDTMTLVLGGEHAGAADRAAFQDAAERRMMRDLNSRMASLTGLYLEWMPVARRLGALWAQGLEVRLDAGPALASVQVRNSEWGAWSAREMLGTVASALGLRAADLAGAIHQGQGDVVTFAAELPPAQGSSAPALRANFTLMGPGSVVGHWPMTT